MENIPDKKEILNFEETTSRAEEKLFGMEKILDNSILNLPVERLEAVIKKETEKTVEKLSALFRENMSEWADMTFSENQRSFETLLLPLLRNFPPNHGEMLLKNLLSQEEWRKNAEHHSYEANPFIFCIASIFSKNHFSEQKENQKSEDAQLIAPFTLTFEKEDFLKLNFFGSYLSDNARITLNGDAEDFLGICLKGGTIIVNGNVECAAGDEMERGKITINGNTGSKTARYMSGGILGLNGEVKNFHRTAFFPTNKGTIIWKGVTLWTNGDWTEDGKRMKENGKIPITEN